MNREEDQIVERCKSGDREAFGELYRTYLAPMRRVVECYVDDDSMVNDILHDGFIVAMTSIDTLRDGSRVESWLTTIMKNLSLQYLNDSNRHVALDDVVDEPIHDGAVGDDALTSDELDTIIGSLPRGYEKVFRLAVLSEMSHGEIGEKLGIAPHTSSSQLAHAKALLRRKIKQYRMELYMLSLLAAGGIVLWSLLSKTDRVENNELLIAEETQSEVSLPEASRPVAEEQTSMISHRELTKNVREHYANSNVDVRDAKDTIETTPSGVTDRAAQPDDVAATDSTTVSRPWLPTLPDRQIADNSPLKRRFAAKGWGDWTLAATYAGEFGPKQQLLLPSKDIGDSSKPEKVVKNESHSLPLIVGLTLSRRFDSRWSVETGLRYTLMRSTFDYGFTDCYTHTQQRIEYVGIPLRANYRIATFGRFSLYGSGGVALDIPFKSRKSVMQINQGMPDGWFTESMNAPVQWSVEGGLGADYSVTPWMGIYVAPTVHYYFGTSGKIETYRQIRPVEFSLPLGVRFSF